MPHGGKRNGSGRKPGSGTKKTSKTNVLAAQAAGEGVLPLQVMLEAMRAHHAAGDLDRAAEIAKDAAPYMHKKAVTDIAVTTKEVIKRIKYVVVSVNAGDRSAANGAASSSSGLLGE